MRLRKDVCVSCGACERVCPANCADAKNKTLDGDRCILCLSCAGHCVTGALDYRSGGAEDGTGKDGRRAFLRGGGFLSFSAFSGLLYLAGAVSAFRAPGRKPVYETEAGGPQTRNLPVVLPPGAGDVGSFFARCVGCQACAAACPVGVIRLARNAHPSLVYGDDYCQYSCVECGKICPTNAITRLDVETKRRTRAALSNLTLSRCVAVTKNQACGACAEVCPTHALSMVNYDNVPGLTIPSFDGEYCIGCGACLCVCPADPVAFAVKGVPVQTLTPGVRQLREDAGGGVKPMTADDDFPF
jgi:ferredoxin